MKLKENQWVKVLVRRFESPDIEFIGKVVAINDASVTAECRTPDGSIRFSMEWDNPTGSVWITRMTQQDWAARNRRKHAGFRL